MDPEGERKQIERLNRVRAERDQTAARNALAALRAVAQSSENSMPAILDCVRAYCTVGEICDVLRETFGVYQEQVVV
jgi:methylmalonyl-CoA mutase N-terminal domain/subunit